MSVFLQPIYTQTLAVGSSVNTVNFNNIPQTFTDLKVVISARATGSANNQGMFVQFSGDGGNNYSDTLLRAVSGSVDSYRNTSTNAFRELEIPNDLCTANTFSSIEMYIPNYANTSYKKQAIIDLAKESNSTNAPAMLQLRADLWSNTAAITSIGFGTNISAPNFSSYSTFSLYGVLRQGI